MSAAPSTSSAVRTAASSSHRAPRVPQVLDHEYDGIREYDNPTPGWWHLIVVASVIFSIFYFVFFHMSPLAPSIHDQWHAHQTAEFRELFGSLGELKPDEPTLLRMMADARMQEVAKGIFETNCAACHAKDGGGITGVNLTDDHYKNARQLADLFSVITIGANNGAMPAWRTRLSDNERIILAAYVANLRGTTPKAPRPAEGDALPPWPALPPAQTPAK